MSRQIKDFQPDRNWEEKHAESRTQGTENRTYAVEWPDYLPIGQSVRGIKRLSVALATALPFVLMCGMAPQVHGARGRACTQANPPCVLLCLLCCRYALPQRTPLYPQQQPLETMYGPPVCGWVSQVHHTCVCLYMSTACVPVCVCTSCTALQVHNARAPVRLYSSPPYVCQCVCIVHGPAGAPRHCKGPLQPRQHGRGGESEAPRCCYLHLQGFPAAEAVGQLCQQVSGCRAFPAGALCHASRWVDFCGWVGAVLRPLAGCLLQAGGWVSGWVGAALFPQV